VEAAEVTARIELIAATGTIVGIDKTVVTGKIKNDETISIRSFKL